MISTYFHPFPILAAFTLLIMLAPGDSRAMDIMEAKNPMARGYGLDVAVRRALYIHYFNIDPFEKNPNVPVDAVIGVINPPCKIDELKEGLAKNTCSPMRLSERCGRNCFIWLIDDSVYEAYKNLIDNALQEPCKGLAEATLPEGLRDAHPIFFAYSYRLTSAALHCNSWIKLGAKRIEYHDSRLKVHIGGLW